MRILLAVTNLLMGGAQTFLASLANELAKTEKVYIYCYAGNRVTAEILGRISTRVKVLRYPAGLAALAPVLDKVLKRFGVKKPADLILKELHLVFLVKWKRIRVIHSQLYHADDFITRVFKKRRIPVIITEHGCYNYVVTDGIATEAGVKEIFKRADRVAYIAEKNKQKIIEITGNPNIPFRKMKNGIPKVNLDPNVSVRLRESLQIGGQDFVFGMVARGIKEKGWELAVEAFALLQKETQRAIHLIFIGDSPYMRQLQQQVRNRGIGGIHFLGSQAGPLPWIGCFDVGLLPSYFAGESVPMTIIEYLACGKPVIAADRGEIKDMITHEQGCGGITFSYHPQEVITVGLLRDAMKRYLEDPVLVAEHCKRAEDCFRSFDIEIVARQYLELYGS